MKVRTNVATELFRVVGNLDLGCGPGALQQLQDPAEESRLFPQDTALVRTLVPYLLQAGTSRNIEKMLNFANF